MTMYTYMDAHRHIDVNMRIHADAKKSASAIMSLCRFMHVLYKSYSGTQVQMLYLRVWLARVNLAPKLLILLHTNTHTHTRPLCIQIVDAQPIRRTINYDYHC